MNIKFELNKLYYKYIDTSSINHFKLLLLTEEYRQISKNYFEKYPNSKGWINLNKELFDINKQAEIEYIEGSKKQSEIKNSFFENREIICKNDKNKDFIICSKHFQDFYVNSKYYYHYGQYTEDIIKDIIIDIQNIDKNSFGSS
jgi:hypothetical protein